MCDHMAGNAQPKRLRISELNPHLLCALCGGYLIDASTIIECLHSFCKTCIVCYLETSNYCPICEVLIHKTRPWQNIRLDHSLQNAVYKMVPGLFQNEMRRRREFYERQSFQDKRGRSSSQPQGELGDRIIFSQDEEFSLSIEFSPDGKPVKEVKESKTKSLKRPKNKCQPDKRYLKCPAGLRVEHMKKFIRSKFSLPQTVEIDLFYETEPLNDSFSLMDVAYIYEWKRDCVLRLFYSFYEIPSKLRKVEAVTNVTEKIFKNVVKDKGEEKAAKRDKEKKAKGKKDKTREKRQDKLSGKKKVNADGVTSANEASVTPPQTVAASAVGPIENSTENNAKNCPTSLVSSKNMKPSLPTSTSPKQDKQLTNNSLFPDKCNNKDHITFQSPTKQKPPPENTSYSIITNTINRDGHSQGQESKTSIKLLIKSSDIKDCRNQTCEILSCLKDTLNKSEELTTKSHAEECHRHETESVSKSNLFDNMNSFARSSQSLTASSESFSSPPAKLLKNIKKLKDTDIKCDIMPGVHATKPKVTSLENVKVEIVPSTEHQIVRTSGCSLSTKQEVDSKPFVCKLNKKTDVMTGHKSVLVSNTSAAQQLRPSIDLKQETHPSNQIETKKVSSAKVKDSQDFVHNVEQDAKESLVTSNNEDVKLGSREYADRAETVNHISSKQEIYDSVQSIAKSQNNNITDALINLKQRNSDNKQFSSKKIKSEAKQAALDCKQRNDQKIVNENKQKNCDAKQALTETELPSNPDPHKANKIQSVIPVIGQRSQSQALRRPSTTSGESTVKKKPRVQENSTSSRDVADAPENNGFCCLGGEQISITLDPASVKANCKPQAQPSSVQGQSLTGNQNPEIVPVSDRSVNIDAITKTSPQFNSRASISHINSSPSSSPALDSGVATTTTSSSPLPAPPKLLKTVSAITTGISSYMSTSFSIASIVSASSTNVSSIPKSPATSTKQGLSTSSSSTMSSGTLSRACDTTSTERAKSSPLLSTATTATKVSLVVPSISSVSASTFVSSFGSKVISAQENDSESRSASLSSQVKLTASTSSPSDSLNKMKASAFVPSTALLDSSTSHTTATSIAMSLTAPLPASCIAPSTTAVSVASSAGSSTITPVNVVNSFLNIPPKETSTLKETGANKGHESTDVSSSNLIRQEAIKPDNFLFDTKSSETETSVTASSPKTKDLGSAAKQAPQNLVKVKPNSSTQFHGLTNDKSTKSAESHITAIHQLPKTISQTSKPYSVARSMCVSSSLSNKNSNVIQTTKISTLMPKSSPISSKAGTFSKSFSYPSNINSVPSSRSFLHTTLAAHVTRPDLAAVMNGSSYDRAMLHKASALSPSLSPSSVSSSHHRSSSKHGSKDGDGKMEKGMKNKAIPPLTIPKSCLIGTTLKLQRSPGSTDHYIFAPLSHYVSTAPAHHNGERNKSKEVKHNGSRTPSSPPRANKDCVFVGERQRVPTIKISDINRNPIIVESGVSGNGNSGGRNGSQYRSYSHGSSRSPGSENGSARTHSRGGSDSNSPTGSSDRSDRSPAREARRPSDSELLMAHHWHEYSAADLLFNGFKLPVHQKCHDLHYDTDAMPLDYSQSSSKS